MDYDGPDEEWIEDEEEDSEDALLSCPSCGAAVHEDTQQCPHCGDWIIPVYPKGHTKQLVWALITIILVLALIRLTIL